MRLLFIRDSVAYVAFTAYFFLAGPYNNFAVTVAVGVMWFVGKRFKGTTAKLDLLHRKWYFALNCFFLGGWLALLLSWILRHSSAPTWCMGSLGIIVLLVLIYASYDSVLGRNAKV